jgi:hypothetical protein
MVVQRVEMYERDMPYAIVRSEQTSLMDMRKGMKRNSKGVQRIIMPIWIDENPGQFKQVSMYICTKWLI